MGDAGGLSAASLTEQALFSEDELPPRTDTNLAQRFTLPPFSLLDQRSGWWQDRKRQWLDMGLASGEGRTAQAYSRKDDGSDVGEKMLAISGGVSIFDPVLCELLVRWWSPPGGLILDPFAGGSVRGLVSATLGRRYVGIDLSATQLEANREQAAVWEGDKFGPGEGPQWHHGDSAQVLADWRLGDAGDPLPAAGADFIMSCPPYHDLEVYSDHPADISAMKWDAFEEAYWCIIAEAVHRLAPNRFAAFVVGDIRDKGGFYRNFIGTTVEAFRAAGAAYYNEAILVSPAGTLQLRAARPFEVSRKLGRTHQNVLVFCKGDPKAAAQACGGAAVEAGTEVPQ